METRANSGPKQAFAIWLTGLPASGKSTIAAALGAALKARSVDLAILESDVLRRIFTPHPRYDDEERDSFYNQLAYVGVLLTQHGIPVLFDATANRRVYRDRARAQIPRFLEVYVDSPLKVCVERDPKGIYRRGLSEQGGNVPGLQDGYEPPIAPDVTIHGDREDPAAAAAAIIAKLEKKGYL